MDTYDGRKGAGIGEDGAQTRWRARAVTARVTRCSLPGRWCRSDQREVTALRVALALYGAIGQSRQLHVRRPVHRPGDSDDGLVKGP